mmetsp:Transcript_31725/g.68570  ORF Transcript_31725/g.68570 Transcript_31725/m.68570 type:complete len:300 (-) Transcript_31725:213-1112(-)
MINTERSTFSIGFTLRWMTVSVKVRSKLWVAATTTWREASSMGSAPDLVRASNKSMALFFSVRCSSSPRTDLVGPVSSDSHHFFFHVGPRLTIVGLSALSSSSSCIFASSAPGSLVTSAATASSGTPSSSGTSLISKWSSSAGCSASFRSPFLNRRVVSFESRSRSRESRLPSFGVLSFRTLSSHDSSLADDRCEVDLDLCLDLNDMPFFSTMALFSSTSNISTSSMNRCLPPRRRLMPLLVCSIAECRASCSAAAISAALHSLMVSYIAATCSLTSATLSRGPAVGAPSNDTRSEGTL